MDQSSAERLTPTGAGRNKNICVRKTDKIIQPARLFVVLRTRVEGVPSIDFVHAQAYPLGDDPFFALIDGATGMLRKAVIHGECFGIDVTEENGVALLGFDVHTGVAEVGVSANLRNVAGGREERKS